MVTFIVVLILIAVVITFAVLLIIKKGKLAKKWFISFGGVVLAGIALAATAVNKVVEIAQKQRTLQLQQSMENISIDMAREWEE